MSVIFGSRTIFPEQLPPGLFPHRKIAPWAIPTLEYCITPRVFTLGQLQPKEMTIFSWLFSVSFPWPNYMISFFCYDSKSKNDSSNGVKMEFKVVQRYYPVTLTKRSQFFNVKQFFKKTR